MNKDLDPSRYRTIPEPHIRILKRPDDQAEHWGRRSRHHTYQSAEASVKRTSLTHEVKEGSLTNMILSKDPDSIANMEKGTTFAARARAAELNSARAAAAAKDAMTSGGEDEIPELAPVSLGSLKFTRRTARKASRGPRSQDPPVDLSNLPTSSASPHLELRNFLHPSTSKPDPGGIVHQTQNSSTTPRPPSRGGKPNELATLGGHSTELNQQAIRQKVREVSAKQQAINNNNQDEAFRQGVHGSTSSSPYSSQGSRVDQAFGSQKADVNTQYIREIRRQSKDKRETNTSLSEQPRFLTLVDQCGNIRAQTRTPGTFSSHSNEHRIIEQSFSETAHTRSEQKISESDASPLDSLAVSTEACPSINEFRSPSSSRCTNLTGNQSQLYNPQLIDIKQSAAINSHDSNNQMSRVTGPPNQPGYAAINHTSPGQKYNVPQQEASRSSSGSSAIIERSDINTDKAPRRATNPYPMYRDASDPREVQALVSGQLGLHVQSYPSNGTRYAMQQKGSPHLQNYNQSSDIEYQSSLGRQSLSGDGQQTQPAYGQIPNRPSYEQIEYQATFSQSHPQAMDKFADLEKSLGSSSMAQSWDKSNDDPFTDRARSSSTITPATQPYAVPAHLRAKSPAYIPSIANPSFRPRPSNPDFLPRFQAKALLPAVKGTDRDQHFKQQPLRQSLRPDTWSQDEIRFTQPGKIRTDLAHSEKNVRSKHDESLDQLLESKENSQHSQSSTVVAGKTTNFRDPMPYTGFSASASKKEQLLGSLNKTINEAKARGDLSKSNRSVLFDPVASSAGTGISNDASSKTPDLDNLALSGSKDPTTKLDALVFDHPDPSSTRATPDYDPNILKDSEPLPPSFHQQDIETKTLSSPSDGFGLRGPRNGHSSVAPQHSPGLSQTTNSFPDVLISNDDGFWDDSLAVNSGDPAIEERMRALGCKITSRDEEQMHVAPNLNGNAWIEEQKYLLLPTARPTNEQLDEVAKAWLVSAEETMGKSVKNVLLRSEGLGLLPSGTRYWQQSYEPQKPQQVEHTRTASSSRLAPIGSERTHTYASSQATGAISFHMINKAYLSTSAGLTKSVMTDTEIRKRAAIDVMAPVIANLSSYSAGEDPGPLQRYSQPPAWCIDNTEAGRKSFFNDNWGDVPKRVGRDPRYQQTMHEGRSTYFEDPNLSGRRERDVLPGYKTTTGWGKNRK